MRFYAKISKLNFTRRVVRVVEGAALEMLCGETHPGFESLTLRQNPASLKFRLAGFSLFFRKISFNYIFRNYSQNIKNSRLQCELIAAVQKTAAKIGA